LESTKKGFCCDISHKLINVEHPSNVYKELEILAAICVKSKPSKVFLSAVNIHTGLASTNPLKMWNLRKKSQVGNW